MEVTQQVSSKLKDRILWFDGDTTVKASKVMDALTLGTDTSHLCVDAITPDIEQYNKLVPPQERITVKENLNDIIPVHLLPDEYINLKISDYVIEKLMIESDQRDFTDQELTTRIERIQDELSLYKSFELFPILRTLIYIINTLDTNNVVWGVGRGSSVSSYVLYLIGVHDVDSVEYELDIREFLR